MGELGFKPNPALIHCNLGTLLGCSYPEGSCYLHLGEPDNGVSPAQQGASYITCSDHESLRRHHPRLGVAPHTKFQIQAPALTSLTSWSRCEKLAYKRRAEGPPRYSYNILGCALQKRCLPAFSPMSGENVNRCYCFGGRFGDNTKM